MQLMSGMGSKKGFHKVNTFISLNYNVNFFWFEARFAFIVSIEFVLIVVEMATQMKFVIGNMDFLHILERIMLWLIVLHLNSMKKGRKLMIQRVIRVLNPMASPRSNISAC
jgi:hypothetical protein